MTLLRYLLVLFLGIVFLGAANAQKKVKLLHANELEGDVINGVKVKKLKGNVGFEHNDALMYCDSAYQYDTRNAIDAWGHVRITQGDSITLTGNTLNYDGNTKTGVVKGNVVLKDRKTTVITEALNYDMANKLASYNTGGTIKDDKNTLTSQYGVYDTQNKLFHFTGNVKVVNPTKGFVLTSDTMDYNSITKIVTLHGPTKIISPDGVVYADHGEYNTLMASSDFKGKAKVEAGNYTLYGDRIYYDEKNKHGVSEGNVQLISEKDKIIITGDIAYYWGGKGISKVFNNAVLKNIGDKDTLFISADTLISLENSKKPKDRKLLAFNHTKIFRPDLQGICDSLVYNFGDSTIYFFTDPVLWNNANQIEADSINIQMANKKIDKMNLRQNSIIISTDSLKNFNQVKGKDMTAFFTNNKISRINVNANGESIYYVLDKDALIGLNRAICSDITVRFKENKLQTITFIKKPEARFIPPHEIKEEDTRLKGFKWRIEEKPTRNEVLHLKKVL